VSATTVRTLHTADLSGAQSRSIRALLDGAFAGHPDGEFTDADWDHTLGGQHALVLEGDEVVAHASVVQRRLLYGGRALRTGYVEGVAVRADRRRRGLGGAVMGEAERIIRGAYDLGALGSADEATALYAGRGWQVWRGRTGALTPWGVKPTPDVDGWIYVYPVAGVDLGDLTGDLTCDWRDGDVW
jgi:aminoglycoside 2'-N-acetyltransferase I